MIAKIGAPSRIDGRFEILIVGHDFCRSAEGLE
jgi:hypothetical protein